MPDIQTKNTAPETDIEFWMSFASPYSYLSAARLSRPGSRIEAEVRWKPAYVVPIFRAHGWKLSPFVDHPHKQAYIFRDVEREAEASGIPFRRPLRFPQDSRNATSVALLAAREGFGKEFCWAVYQANYVEHRDIEDRAVIHEVAAAVCGPVMAHELLARHRRDDVVEWMAHDQADAIRKGIFGVPTFVVGSELFWGNDRLSRALEYWRSHQRVADSP